MLALVSVALAGLIVVLGGFLYLAVHAVPRVPAVAVPDPVGMIGPIVSEPPVTIDDRRAAVITQMQTLARLETTSYTVEQVIDGEKAGNAVQKALYGDKILLIAHGEVVAGVDLSKLNPNSITVTDTKSVHVVLPPSEIFSARLDNGKTRVYERDKGIFSKGDDQLETQVRQRAEQSIRTAACDDGVLTRAAQSARQDVQSLLTALQFTTIQIDAPVGQCQAPQ